MQSLARAIPALALLVAVTACATPQSRAEPTPQRYVLTAEELKGAGAQNVYDAIQKLRPEFLKTRGTGTISHIPTQGGLVQPAEAVGRIANQAGVM